MSILDNNILDQTDIIKYDMPDVNTLVYDPQSNKSNLNIYWSNKYIFKDIENISFTLCKRFDYFKRLQKCEKYDWFLNLEINLAWKCNIGSITFVFNDYGVSFDDWKLNIQTLLDQIYKDPYVVDRWVLYGWPEDDMISDLGFGTIKYVTFEDFMKIK